MNNTIEKDLKKTLNKAKKAFEKDELLSKYEEAAKKFDELVEKGIVKRRGNNLISITERHLYTSVFNSTKKGNPSISSNI